MTCQVYYDGPAIAVMAQGETNAATALQAHQCFHCLRRQGAGSEARIPPQGGYSRDYWLYDCTVQHEDGKVTTGTIDPGQMCYDNPAGFEEIKALSEVMTDYLNKHGTWNEKAPRGWYAHRKAKATA